ncbi:SpoIID/LytB domain-containing protein [Synechococcus sp. M16CYN]|uniref:SpoIID/LytB domain-containing protein n=1 Tax=Synechococcus sp. M16CYN TaxID=3103139 RepID=UPI0032477154
MNGHGTLKRFQLFALRFASIVLVGLTTISLIGSAQRVMPMKLDPQMRVLLYEGPNLLLRADQQQWMQVHGLTGGVRRLRRLQLELSQVGSSVMADLDGERRRLFKNTVLTVENNDPRGIWLGSRRYRGKFRISFFGECLQAVNIIGIETYLTSVVGSEMPHYWPLAALQAQAVASRTYALQQRTLREGWDVKANVTSQVYRGVEAETLRTRKAVADTQSLVLVHGDKLINAVFHSSSGGITEASGMVWRQQLPYLLSVPDYDQHSPVHRWQEHFAPPYLFQLLPEIGGLHRIDVISRSASGRVRQARLKGPLGSFVLTGQQLRQRLGLRSTLVEFEMTSAAGQYPDAPPLVSAQQSRWLYRPSPQLVKLSFSAKVPSLLVAPPPLPRTPRSTAQCVLSRCGLQLVVRGQGYGHGVGMSQWGAHGLAKQGADFRTILLHYYRGVDVTPLQAHHESALVLQPPSITRRQS